MNAIAEIQRIEADLYRFIQNASEPHKWIKAYLEPIGVFKNHADEEEHDEVLSSLAATREELDTERHSVKECEKVIRRIVRALQQIGTPQFPGFAMTLQHIATVIQDGDHTVLCDADAIYEAIEAIVEKESAKNLTECRVSIANSDSSAKPTPHGGLKFRQQIQTPSPQTEPENTDNHENQTESAKPVAHAARRLPLFGGCRAA